ncbi:hypothetical protein AGMMS49928_25840 [Spirochaetia bacterium]|nr:hypothetical protein AGMMS49928_25840 [Spirochaetia bacterium]
MSEKLKKTIMAIDDDITVLTSIRTILAGHFEVCLAKSADMAWTILNNNTRVDMILLDVEMPNVSGIEFVEILKKLSSYYYIPVIFVTSHATPEVIRKAKENGAVGFIAKPFAARTLLEKINSYFVKSGEQFGNQEILIQKLRLMDNACKKGLSSETEKLADQLSKIHINLDTDSRVIDICKYAHALEYKTAVEKITETLEFLSKRGGSKNDENINRL